MITISTHSFVDVITNSSSIIYSNYSGSVEPAKELIAAFAKAIGFAGNPDDLFYIDAFYDGDHFIDALDNYREEDDGNPDIPDINYADYCEMVEKILKKEIEKPEWMGAIEDTMYDNFTREEGQGMDFWILPKDDKYKPLADAIKSFLHSPDFEASFS